jgi:Winged helix DNA-binding domain
VSAGVLTTRDLNRALLARQSLLDRQKTTISRTLTHLVALQAQVPRPPFVALWTRLRDFDRDDLLKPLARRSIVRVVAMRGTLHLMTDKDAVAFRGAMQPMLTRGMETILRERATALDIGQLETAARRFFDKAPATFDALRKHLKERFPKGDERAMAYAIRMHVPIVQIPTDVMWGFPSSADFALADGWLGRKISTDTAPAHQLVTRYLAAFGPATPADAQCWLGLQGLREVFEDLRLSLATFRDERKRELFDIPNAPRPAADTPAPVRFLAEFDNVLLGHADRSRIIDDRFKPKVITKNLLVPGTFLVDGFVAGTWKVERKAKTATLKLSPFLPLQRKTVAALEEEGDKLLAFLEPDADALTVKLRT